MTERSQIRRLASRTLRFAGIHYCDSFYLEKNLGTAIEPVVSPIELDISHATEDDLATIIRMRGQTVLKRFQIARAVEGVCYCAKHNGEIAGYMWLTRRAVILDELHVADLPANGAYMFGSYVFPHFRGKKIFQSLTYQAYDEMRQAGCLFVGNLVGRNNAPAVAARKRFGVLFQDSRLLKLPGFKAITVGKPFVIGASASGMAISP
ncbi:MAG: GNAT family N-acetyltransferase [Candidatus Abyssobacteria bacterium SURF_17]|uniref:GNAT family N-acetyltransferase n=1 Tax=Candidatus Abyssobacteria bacterium SURF_17 TaxID=2093361 RepID=A0A419EQ23_9BACT|nr:MAG: GNAT family N-acetyltransferase [Candidatus Abyssubacteria bacterium SURF_17]